MTSKGKEIYNTIKRSLSSTASAVATSSSMSNHSRYVAPSVKQWIHPPDILLNGRVEYSVKMLGQIEVKEAKGTHVIRDAIHAIRFQLQVNRGVTGHSGAKLKKVDLHINVDGVTIVDNKTKMILFKYPLHRISFCADDKQDKRVFSFIAKAESSSRHDCFVFLSEKLAEQITLTVGEAFDLAYQKFLEKNGRDLENRKQLIVLRKRIAELETENNELRIKLAEALKKNSVNGNIYAPSLPTTPMPSEPPSSVSSNNTIPRALIPPPSFSKRQNIAPNSLASELRSSGPCVGRKLENLELDKMEDIFDNQFDPRADERKKKLYEKTKKDKFGLDPFGDDFMNEVLNMEPNTGRNDKNVEIEPTPEDLEKMLSMVDERLSELRDGFASGVLAMGDTGDSARDLHNIYSVPQQSSMEEESLK